jgi:hypothetical protein
MRHSKFGFADTPVFPFLAPLWVQSSVELLIGLEANGVWAGQGADLLETRGWADGTSCIDCIAFQAPPLIGLCGRLFVTATLVGLFLASGIELPGRLGTTSQQG